MSKPRILLADDSITIQKVVNLTFADQGMDVVTFADGDSAVEHLDEIKPDIVLADVNMPGINGYQLCELMRSDDANRHIPVVLLVGSFEPFDRDEAERVGSDSYLTKPFTSIADLVATVQGLLDKRKSMVEVGTNGEASEPILPRPDTSDIDHLYKQSFVETVELPRTDTLTSEFGNGLDDEMIQTSYAEPDLEPPDDETYFVSEESDEFGDAASNNVDFETESLIADSMPVENNREMTDIGDGENDQDTGSIEPSYSDPFESVADDPPPVSTHEGATPSTAKYGFSDDLLELPGSGRSTHASDTRSHSTTDQPQQITSLSPELIDLIVEKVVERLQKKY